MAATKPAYIDPRAVAMLELEVMGQTGMALVPRNRARPGELVAMVVRGSLMAERVYTELMDL
jgi:hypothetical protein